MPGCPIRTITAGITPGTDGDGALTAALGFLERARARFAAEGWEVQTLRVATPSLAPEGPSAAALARIRSLDRRAAAAGALLAAGPLPPAGRPAAEIADWALELVGSTAATSFSVAVAGPRGGVDEEAVGAAAAIVAALGRGTPRGEGSFRFAAAARVPAGTPFFPVAWHAGGPSFALGLESAGLVSAALLRRPAPAAARAAVVEALRGPVAAVEAVCLELEAATGHSFGGIDLSPAPGLERSIGEGIEALAGAPFGGGRTLAACAAVTGALLDLPVRRCGYSGLMLPVLEDPRLAQRASEGRFTARELLLYSAVCGTGLDLVPLPGETPPATLAALIAEVAALAVRLDKPLSARLFPVPGHAAGQIARFPDPPLTDCTVMPAG